MKIAQLTSNFYSSRPDVNMAIYSHAAWLANGLATHGNNVTFFGGADSVINGEVVSVVDKPTLQMDISDDIRKYYLHALISECFKRASEFDIIHTHLTLWPSFYSPLAKTPTVMSLHSPLPAEIKDLVQKYKDHYYVSFSLAQRKKMPELNWFANVYHGIDTQLFNFNPHPQDYFLYLGRVTEEKGVHLAIEAAEAAGVPLWIAGHSYPKEGYWHDQIEKKIDGKMIRYVGEANLQTKIELLQNAKGLLFPTQYDEVFGLVMIEAMSCGTPVIAWNKGSVPEVIKHGQTGYIVDSVKGMTDAIKSIDKISRETTRERAVKLFSTETMVSNYERMYVRIIEDYRAKNKAK